MMATIVRCGQTFIELIKPPSETCSHQRRFQRLFEKRTASSMPISRGESVLTYKKRLITKGFARNHQKHTITTGLERYCKGGPSVDVGLARMRLYDPVRSRHQLVLKGMRWWLEM